MKSTFTLLLTLLAGLVFGQNYKLFNSSSQKVFTTFPVPSTTYSLAFDSVRISGMDSVYYSFLAYGDTMVNSNCGWWGAPQCIKQDVPVWVGAKIKHNNNGSYIFFNNSNDSLNFNFNSNVGDTTLFYSDNIEKFSIVFEKEDTLSVLDNIDSSRFYKILHTDLSGGSINSALNGRKIIVSKNWGLVQFLIVDSFPQIEKSLILLGNNSPDGGINALTSDILYDYQPGDEIQYHDYSSFYYNYGPPSISEKYTKYSFFNRITTADTIKYKAMRYYFDAISSIQINDTVTLNYYRFDTIASIPFEFFDGNNKSFSIEEYCGQNLWTFKTNPEPYIGYCVQGNCWGPVDTQGPVADMNTTYVAGLGRFYYNVTFPYFSGGYFPYSFGTDIVYFKKNGISCGAPVTVGITQLIKLNNEIRIQPNPASNIVKISSFSVLKSMTLFDINWKIIYTKIINNKEEELDITQFNNGIYFVKFILSDNSTVSKKIVVLKD